MLRAIKLGLATTASVAILAGCGQAPNKPIPGNPQAKPDLALVFVDEDMAGQTDDGGAPQDPNICGDFDPQCQSIGVGPDNNKPFPLSTDPNPDPNTQSDGLGRNPMGYLQLDQTQANFHFIWIAQDSDGTVSKIDSRTMKEVARYSTVTCYSLPKGSSQACDGQGNGCCASDSDPQWQNRKNKVAEGPPQNVQRSSNSPSRTAVDFNGDIFVANRAFGGQASVTKIANDLSGCKDRNKNGKIDTSSDVNKDGRIDKNDVKEYLGIEDECILWTANHGGANATGRPLGLGPGANDTGPSDAWAGEYSTGKFFRFDGTSGKIKDEVQLPGGCNPYGLAVDAKGYGWAPDLGSGELCYFDTRKNTNVGTVRDPTWGKMQGYGITLDRDQNVWVGYDVARYTPDRTNAFNNLGKGVWTRFGPTSGIGIAADSRTNKQYFVWSAYSQRILRIPASDTPVPKQDTTIANNGWPTINMPGYGVGVDADQNIIAAPQTTVVYRAKVDAMGTITQPDVTSPPKNGEMCPAGDRCDTGSHQYTYSDFTGFGLRNFTRPSGTYTYITPGCMDQNTPAETAWWLVAFDADTPPNTTIQLRARSGPTPKPDGSWGAFTQVFTTSPADLHSNGVLIPNSPDQTNAYYLQVEFTLKTNDRNATPKLKSFNVAFKCGRIPG